MVSVAYCQRILRIVLSSSPATYLHTQAEWVRDVNAAIHAVQLAGSGDDREAVRLASIVAGRWGAV